MPRTYIPRSDGAYRPSPRSNKPIPSQQKKRTPVPNTNPPEKKTRPIVSGILIILLVIALIGVAYGVSRWDYLEVQSVEIVGVDRLDQGNIEALVEESLDSRVTRWWNTRNIFLAPHQQIQTRLVQEEPSVSSVRILRRFPDTIVVVIEERYPVFELCSPDQCLFLANDGIAIAHNGTTSFIPIRRTIDSEVGTQVYSQRTIDWLEYLVRTYTIEVGLQIQSIEVVLEGESGILEIAVVTQDGYRVRFDFETDLVVQKNALQVVFEAEIPEDRRSELEYIDLRVPNRVYYRFKDAAVPPQSEEESEDTGSEETQNTTTQEE